MELCHWFILLLLLATPTKQFSLDRKGRSHKQNQCSASDSVGLIFTKSYRFTLLITTKTTTPSLVKTSLKDVRAHCFCASLVRTLFIGHARATSFSSARTESKTQQNIELMTFALTWCANIFVGRSVTPTFFSADHFLF